MNADWLRYVAMFESLLAIGATAAMYERIGRFVLPLRTMRTIFGSLILMNVTAIAGIHSRLGEPLNWRTPTALITMTLYLGGLVSLWFYYRGPTGRKQRHSLVNLYASEGVLRLAKQIEQEAPHTGRAFPSRWDRSRRRAKP